MGEQSLTCFAYVCFMPRNDGGFLPYCCAYHELCVRTPKTTIRVSFSAPFAQRRLEKQNSRVFLQEGELVDLGIPSLDSPSMPLYFLIVHLGSVAPQSVNLLIRCHSQVSRL